MTSEPTTSEPTTGEPTTSEPARTPPVLAAELVDRVVGTLDVLIERHLPGFRIPGTFAGHRVEPDVAADLVFTLGHLADAGVQSVAGSPVDDAIATVLRRIDGPETHTFFSYRVAETLARYGPFADNRLIADWDQAARDNLAEACDSSTWIPLLDQGLPRNYAAVLSRCEVGRHALGLLDDESVVDGLIGRARDLLSSNRLRYLDDSTHHIGRYDIYAADVWLFTEPLADRLGPLWAEGLATALGLVEVVGSPDGTAVGWGRSTGVLAAALTIELAALAVAGGHTERPGLWLRRAVDATDNLDLWFRDGLITAHQHRSTYEYRGPFRRLQLTLDILGKLAWAAKELAHADPVLEPGTDAEAYPWQDRLVRFDDQRAAAVWAHRSPGLELVIPFVGATRSDYLPAPHLRGLFEVPVDEGLVCWVPMVNARRRTWTAGGVPAEVVARPNGVTARWDSLVLRGELDPPGEDDRLRLPASCTASWQVDGRSIRFDLELELAADDRPDAITVLVPETEGRPLWVTVEDDDGGRAHADTIEVDGLKEWRSFWSTMPTVHQVDLDTDGPDAHRLSLRVTPALRIASTAYGHHYHDSLYGPLTGRVVPLPPPIGTFARRGVDLDQLDALHLHWPEWFAMDDLDEHRRLIALLADRRIPVVWTAHNLTPHEKRPEVFDPIYQAWAEAVDAVIHHSSWGRARMLERYRFPESTRHVVIPHGHFGELHAAAADRPRAEVEAELGLPPCRWRIGLLGAPRSEKRVQAFLEGVAASSRDDLQVVCWSLAPDDVVPDDPRIAVAEPYEMVSADLYARRLASCDLLALPFDPDGEMLATGLASDVVGLGLGALVSDWGYLTELLGPAGIPCGHTAPSVAAALDALTDEQVEASRAASRALQAGQSWPAIAERTLALFDEVVLAARASSSPTSSSSSSSSSSSPSSNR
ncbi:MAG: hypothetical protein ACXWB2_11700 [Acidimicrobiales bacterium]